MSDPVSVVSDGAASTGLSRGRRWFGLLGGLGLAVVGLILIARPFASLSVLVVLVTFGLLAGGGLLLARAGDEPRPWIPRALGGIWLVAGLVCLAWPQVTTRGIALIAGVSMVVGGVIDLAGGFAGTRDERIASVIWGLASVVLGALALAWPDVTLLVVAVVFGVRTMALGGRVAVASLRGRSVAAQGDPRPKGPVRRLAHVAGVSIVLVVALLLAAISVKLNATTSHADAFYDQPANVPSKPGQLLRSEPFSRDVPDGAKAWRILYTTTRDEGQPAIASGIVVVPAGAATTPHPVVAWAHGTTGIDQDCAPSVVEKTFESGAFFSLDEVIAQGWALVATDYVGLGTKGPHPYLVGQGEARSVLDAVRAARHLTAANVSEQTVVWGHSQGGGAALWTGQIAPTYAPDVPLSGVAALAPASDLLGLVDTLPKVSIGSLFATYVIKGYADTYPDVKVDDYVKPAARTTFDEAAKRCLDATTLASVASSLTIGFEGFDGLSSGPLHRRLEQNTPTGPIEAPLLLAQGEADSLVVPSVQAAYVRRLCSSGQPVDYRTYPGLDHVPLVEASSPLIPQLVRWTHDRFDNKRPTPTCTPG